MKRFLGDYKLSYQWWTLIALLMVASFLLPGRQWFVTLVSTHSTIWRHALTYFGIDNTSGPWYGFWSGFGSDISEFAILGAVIAAIRHKNCYRKGCWRLGHIDPEHGHPACRRHHSRKEQLERSKEDRP